MLHGQGERNAGIRDPGAGPVEAFTSQTGRGRGPNTTAFQQAGDEEGDRGVWMSVWVDDVDEMHRQCVAAGLEVTFFSAHRLAVKCPRDAPSPSRWPRVPGRPRIRAQKVAHPQSAGSPSTGRLRLPGC